MLNSSKNNLKDLQINNVNNIQTCKPIKNQKSFINIMRSNPLNNQKDDDRKQKQKKYLKIQFQSQQNMNKIYYSEKSKYFIVKKQSIKNIEIKKNQSPIKNQINANDNKKFINFSIKNKKSFSKSVPVKFHHIKKLFQIKKKRNSLYQINQSKKITQSTIYYKTMDKTQKCLNNIYKSNQKSMKIAGINLNENKKLEVLRHITFKQNLIKNSNTNKKKLKIIQNNLNRKQVKQKTKSIVNQNKYNQNIAKNQINQQFQVFFTNQEQQSLTYITKQSKGNMIMKKYLNRSKNMSIFNVEENSQKLTSALQIRKCQIKKEKRCSIFQTIEKKNLQKFIISDSLFGSSKYNQFKQDFIENLNQNINQKQSLAGFFINQVQIKQIYSFKDQIRFVLKDSQIQNLLISFIIITLCERLGLKINKERCFIKEVLKKTLDIPFSMISSEYFTIQQMIALLLFTNDSSVKKISIKNIIRLLQKMSFQIEYLQKFYDFKFLTSQDQVFLYEKVVKKFCQSIGLKSTQYVRQSLTHQQSYKEFNQLGFFVSNANDSALLMIKAMNQPCLKRLLFKRKQNIKIMNQFSSKVRNFEIINKNQNYQKSQIASLSYRKTLYQQYCNINHHLYCYQIKNGIYLILSYLNIDNEHKNQQFLLQLLQWILVQMNIQNQFSWNFALQVLAKINDISNQSSQQ